ncbi:hypothetical protein ACHWQZ_G006754 [Mnemiopsis leidyi]
MCTSSDGLPTPEDALPEIPIDQFTASALGLTSTIERYITSGIDINISNIEGWSMLQYASFIGHTDIVNLLLESGADPNKTSRGTCTSLMLASRCGNEPVLVALLNKGAVLEHVDDTGLTALHYAVNSGQDGSVTVLLRHSKRMSQSEGNVLLHSAVSRANAAVLKALLEGGLIPSSATRLTMIEIAQTRGDSELLQHVVSCGNHNKINEDPFNRYLLKGPQEMQKLLQNCRPALQGRSMLAPASPGMTSPIFTPTLNTVEDVLKYLKLEKYLLHFEKEDIDLQTFLTLTDTDLKAIPIDLLGPRKKILNYIKLVKETCRKGDAMSELQMAQQSVASLTEKVKLGKENDLKNQQIIQSLFMSYQNIRESKDKILTSLTNASFVLQHIQEELTSCKETFSCSDGSSIFASSWPSVFKESRGVKQEEEHIALSSVNSVLSSPYTDNDNNNGNDNNNDRSWSSSWDEYNSGSSNSTLNASCSADKTRKHLESALMYVNTLHQHLLDSKQAANNMSP